MKKVKLPQGMRYYIYNGVEDLTRVEIRFMLNGKNKSKLIKFDGSVKNLKLIKSKLEAEVSKSDYIEPIKWHKSEYEKIIDREVRRKSKVTKHDFF